MYNLDGEHAQGGVGEAMQALAGVGVGGTFTAK
jgi:hypothetical protein